MAILPYVGAGAMHGAVVPIASVTGVSATFTNIPQTYQDLMIVQSVRGTYSNPYDLIVILMNGDYATNYSATLLQGDGASATSFRYSSSGASPSVKIPSATSTAGVFGSVTHHILNYANTTTYKTMLSRAAGDTNGAGYTTLSAYLYRSIAAISQITVQLANANATSNSTYTLYGIRTVGQ